jgi:hypothetical protein
VRVRGERKGGGEREMYAYACVWVFGVFWMDGWVEYRAPMECRVSGGIVPCVNLLYSI